MSRTKNKRSKANKQPTLETAPSVMTLDGAHEQLRKKITANVSDGYQNFLSRVGVGPGMNNQLSAGYYQFNYLTRNRLQLEAAYRGSWLVGQVVDAVAEDMTRAGIDITSTDAADNIQDLQTGLQRLSIWQSLCDVIKWSRLYGGAIGVMQIDGQDLSTPLRIETVGKGQFSGLTVYDRWQLFPDLTTVITTGPDIGLPAYYYIVTAATFMAANGNEQSNVMATLQNGVRVHHSRIIRLIGIKLPFFQAITEMMWGESELERILDRLVAFDNTTMSVANLVNHAHLRTVRVDRLREILSSGGDAEQGLIKMFEYMRLLQSSEGLTLLDKEDESQTSAYSFAGVSDVMLQFGQQLSGASGIPLVRLFGQAPAGLNSTGESDFRNYYDNINAQQEANLRRGVEKLLKVAYQSIFGEEAPSDLSFKFTPLWQMTAKEKSEIATATTQTVVNAYDAGLVTRPAAIKELKNLSSDLNIFSNITDEDVNEAEQDDQVPMPGEGMSLEEEVEKPIEEKQPSKVNDTLVTKFMKFMKRGKNA